MAMASYGAMRIELLTRDNYETWKIQMRALLVKNDLWTYVGGIKVKPELIDGNAESREACSKWTETDEKAKADLILCISPAELKQIKNCVTSRDIWIKLEEIYQSKGPARKATLLKSLIQIKMPDTGDVRDHLRKFFDVVDKLSEMEIKIDENLLSIICSPNISPLPPVEKNTISLRNREVLRDVESKGSESAEFVYSCNTEIPIKTALSSADAQRWLNALAEELKNILKNETFELVNRPAKKDCIGSRFVLTNKYSPDGSLLKNKARFVARGFSQKPGIDFGETFAPVARQGSIRIMAALSVKLGTEIHQFDVTTAYLNGTLDEEIFMECPAYFKEILEQVLVNEKSNNIA
ncbi:Retrovirus-related Pol polyprotein from transposon RE2 [Araneus ventricosus]|uniref:Retrovirus-related Pol polyprotein from transposon RE2 n=1 Tax=Araneus ventricosus TaxID=182803 RepID=A0A4Y2IG31_ARAVE|nr:Retrovirus-related Pol polyprotein from transposon RE2 [Araneus ventricosus]